MFSGCVVVELEGSILAGTRGGPADTTFLLDSGGPSRECSVSFLLGDEGAPLLLEEECWRSFLEMDH